jgi:hypothetical protein
MTKLFTRIAAITLALGATVAVAQDDARRQAFQQARANAFAQADADGNGVLSPAEFGEYHAAMKAQLEQHRFAKTDTNGDGQLSLDEVQAARGPHRGCHKDKGGPDAM